MHRSPFSAVNLSALSLLSCALVVVGCSSKRQTYRQPFLAPQNARPWVAQTAPPRHGQTQTHRMRQRTSSLHGGSAASAPASPGTPLQRARPAVSTHSPTPSKMANSRIQTSGPQAANVNPSTTRATSSLPRAPLSSKQLLQRQQQLASIMATSPEAKKEALYEDFRTDMAMWIATVAARAMARDASLSGSVERLRLGTTTELQRQGFRMGPQRKSAGSIQEIMLRRYASASDWLVVDFGLRSGCGRDDSSYIFRIANGRAQQLASSTARRGFRREGLGTWLRMGTKAAAGRFATLGRLRQCGAKTRHLQARLLEFKSAKPAFVTRFETEAELAPGSTPRLWLRRGELQIHYSGKTSSWRSHRHRQVRLNYRLSEPMVRVAPFARSPSDAVEDWLEGSTATAEALCRPERRGEVMRWRKRMAAIRTVRAEVVLRPFDIGNSRFDVGVACWGCTPAQAYFVRLRFNGRRYHILGARRASTDDLDVIVHGPEAMKAFGHHKAKKSP